MNEEFWRARRVGITGHTGFKGSWLASWLTDVGAEVSGFALPPEAQPDLYTELKLAQKLDQKFADIRDVESVSAWILEKKPEVIFHLAAQPLVIRSYQNGRSTWETNVMGTINVLEAIRRLGRSCIVLVITTDKVYQNRLGSLPFIEDDRLGGEDPYSSSKSAVELAVHSWRESFFLDHPEVRIATARAGNVIGGGDWSENRIVPDLVRSLSERRPVLARNPEFVRPWQHVLDPLSGYICLAERLYEDPSQELQTPFNFGPRQEDNKTVRQLVEECLLHWSGEWSQDPSVVQGREKTELRLDCKKACSMLGWEPRLEFSEAVQKTIVWYRSFYEKNANASEICRTQIADFRALGS